MLRLFAFIFVLFFTLSCSKSDSSTLITSFSDDINTTTLDTNRTLQINVFAHYSNGSSQNITDTLTWKSSDSTVATVNAGLVTTYTLNNSVDISYETKEKDSDGTPFYTKTVVFNVKDLTLKAITLSKSSLTLSVGATTALSATGTFEDNVTNTLSYQDITNDINWSSADTNVSSVVLGVVKGIAEGNTTVTASESNISARANVEIVKVHYTSLTLSSIKTTFNVAQTTQLEARALTDKNETILLKSSEVVYSSSNSAVVSLSSDIATALSVGSVVIGASIVGESNITDTLSLTVSKANYLRIFKNGVELDFPYTSNESNTTLSATLATFTLQAIGVDFVVANLKVSDFNGSLINVSNASFSGLSDGDTLSKDINVSIELLHDGSLKQLYYQFDINDSFGSKFEQKYEETN